MAATCIAKGHSLQLSTAISPTAESPEEEPPCKLLHTGLHVASGCTMGSALGLLALATSFCYIHVVIHLTHGGSMHCKRYVLQLLAAISHKRLHVPLKDSYAVAQLQEMHVQV